MLRSAYVGTVVLLVLASCEDEPDHQPQVPPPACSVDADCPPADCGEDFCCYSKLTCEDGFCSLSRIAPNAKCGTPPEVAEGIDAPVGAGLAFGASSIEFEVMHDEGDGLPRVFGTSALAMSLNATLAGAIDRGGLLAVAEISGFDSGYEGFDRSVTVQLLLALDADGDATNNFGSLDEDPGCCGLRPRPSGLQPSGVAVATLPGYIRDGRLETMPDQPMLTLPVGSGTSSAALSILEPRLSGDLLPDLSGMAEVRFRGTLVIRSLTTVLAPCAPDDVGCADATDERFSLLDVVFRNPLVQADVDLDGDGLECTHRAERADRQVSLCCDGPDIIWPGCDPVRCERPLPPVSLIRPSSCAERPEFNDGLSFSLLMRGTAVRIVP